MTTFAPILALYLVFCAISLSSGLQFDVRPRELRCVGTELDRFETVIFATSASTPTILKKKQKLTLTVTDPDENTIFDEKISIGVKSKELEHKVEKRGVYQMCYELHDGLTPVRVFFHVDYKPKTAGEGGRKVGKDDMSTLSAQLDVLSERIRDISREIEHARKQEIDMKQAGEATTWSVQWFSIMSIVILLATSLWQIIYLRTFFVSKKLL
eukprot:gene16273-18571_t